MFNFKKKKKDMPAYYNFDAIEFIQKETGIGAMTIAKVLISESGYMKKAKIQDWRYYSLFNLLGDANEIAEGFNKRGIKM